MLVCNSKGAGQAAFSLQTVAFGKNSTTSTS